MCREIVRLGTKPQHFPTPARRDGGPGVDPACNDVIMITNEAYERVRGWFSGRLPQDWQAEPAGISIDRDEIVVTLHLPDVEAGESEAETDGGAGRTGQRVPRGDPRAADGDRP